MRPPSCGKGRRRKRKKMSLKPDFSETQDRNHGVTCCGREGPNRMLPSPPQLQTIGDVEDRELIALGPDCVPALRGKGGYKSSQSKTRTGQRIL